LPMPQPGPVVCMPEPGPMMPRPGSSQPGIGFNLFDTNLGHVHPGSGDGHFNQRSPTAPPGYFDVAPSPTIFTDNLNMLSPPPYAEAVPAECFPWMQGTSHNDNGWSRRG